MTDRPRLLVVVAGTGTEIGKTWVGVGLVADLRAGGWIVAARKPAQSAAPVPAGDDPARAATDADLLAEASSALPGSVCPPHRSYPLPMAPPMAAEALGLAPPTMADLVSETECSWGGVSPDIGLVELAGGVASPMAIDGDGADFVGALRPDRVVLVADGGLGTINSVRLAVGALQSASLAGIVVFLNRFDATVDLQLRNLGWLRDRVGLIVETDPARLATRLADAMPSFCGSCGSDSTECGGGCRRPLDPDRFCERCGRRVVVSISPGGHISRCRFHGPIA